MRMTVLALLLLLAAPAAAQKPDESDSTPESLVASLGLAPDEDDVRARIAAAEGQPLGSAQNPVRVGGPPGEHAYIARLRCADGAAPRVGQRHNDGIGAFGTIVDVYPLDCGAAAPGQVNLVMDMYHSEHREDRAPPGFTILPR